MSRVVSMFLTCFLLCLGESSTFLNHCLISNLYLTWFIIKKIICLKLYKDISLSFLEVASQVSQPYMTTNKMNKLCIKWTTFGVMGQQTNVGIWTLSLLEKILKIMQVKNASMDMTCFFDSPIKHNIYIMVHKGW